MRKKIIAGNWKMNTDKASAASLADAIVRGVSAMTLPDDINVVVCPPFPLLPVVHEHSINSRVALGAQTVSEKPGGAFTGEVSASMLKSVGCEYAIVGHSERRLMYAESDLDACFKANAVVNVGLRPILCVGETIAEREQDRTTKVLERQVKTGLDGFFEFNVRSVVIAYEPIWAIGTGLAATPEQAEEAHAFIRGIVKEIYGAAVAEDISILYGGSLNPTNAAEILARPNIDGGLIGGASLEAESFLAIVRAAMQRS